jgi:Fe-S oxidoreductase
MCPSYQATRDEKHSTRGRAHLLFEMLKGETISGGWKSEEVKEALDLCLACKGCKSDCPTNVDMATYKAEFLSHYYEGRLRPRQAYAFGFAPLWLRLGSYAPRVANFLMQNQGLSAIAKFLSGTAQDRKIPALARRTLMQQWRPRTAIQDGQKRVMLWPDTFTNYLQPHIGLAANAVLEKLGHNVSLPIQRLCCGRPLYDYGFLDMAKRQLKQILIALEPEIQAGIPLIVLEPSCAAVFRDELINLFPEDPLAQKLHRQTFLFSEFVGSEADHLPTLSRKALVQTHCHQKSVLGAEAEEHLFQKLKLDVSRPEAGCCGMAGAFGFEAEHEALSRQIGERALLPAIRQAPSETLVIAGGFSCREQIYQATGRRALHPAEVLQLAYSQA